LCGTRFGQYHSRPRAQGGGVQGLCVLDTRRTGPSQRQSSASCQTGTSSADLHRPLHQSRLAGPQTGPAIQPPLHKDWTRPGASAYYARASPCQCLAHDVGKPWRRPGRADVAPAKGLFVDRRYYPLLAELLRPALAVRSRRGPNVDGVRCPDSTSEPAYHSSP